MWLVVTVVPGLVDAGSLTALLRGSLISTLDFIAPCFFVAYFIRDQKSRDRIVRHLLIAGSIVALFGLFEFATATNFFVNLQPQLSHSEIWTVIYQRGGLARVTANFGQPISFGRYFAFLLPIAIIYCTKAQGASSQAHQGSARGRSLYAVATILCVLGVLISLSGGPFWGALVAMAVLVALKPKSTLRLSIAGAGLFALPALFFLPLNSIQSVLLAFLGQNTAVSSSISTNAGVRLAVLQFVERVLPRSPLFGFGSFERIPYMPTILPNGDIVNTYAVYLLLYGIVGLLAFLIIIGWAVWTAARNIFGRPESPQRVFAIALFASLMGQLGIMIGVSPVGPGAQFFWVLIGLIGSLCWTPEPQAVISERVVAGVVAEQPAHA
jgi:O-antigen ligase